MKFYKDRFGKWHNEEDFLKMAQIFCPAFPSDIYFLPSYLKDIGCIKEEKILSNPSVIDYLLMNMRVEAIRRYREIHGCTLMESWAEVEKIEKDMEDMKK